MRALALLRAGLGPAEVARQVGVTGSIVSQWKKRYAAGGRTALQAIRHPGPTPKLTAAQCDRLLRMLLKGARAAGYPTELWTLERIAALIQRTFVVAYEPSGVWRLLHRLGWSCQKPQQRARERDEEAIHLWRTPRLAAHKKTPHEAAVTSCGPTNRATCCSRWPVAPGPRAVARRPRLRRPSRPGLGDLGLVGLAATKTARPLLRTSRPQCSYGRLRAVRGRPSQPIPDRHHPRAGSRVGPPRRGARSAGTLRPMAAGRMAAAVCPGTHLVEQAWSHSKYADLANYPPDNIDALANGLIESLAEIASTPQLLRAFLQHAGLRL